MNSWRKIAAGLLLIAPITSSFYGAVPTSRPGSEEAASAEIRQAIETFESRLADALAHRDRPALDSLISPSFTWVHASDGRVESREAWLAAAAQGMALSGQRNLRQEFDSTLSVYGEPGTVVRVSRVQLRDPTGQRESWLRQTHVLVRGGDGAWRLALGQGTLMYEGAPLDPKLHMRYAGIYVISPDRALTLSWTDGALMATFPNGAVSQIFLASPTEEAARTSGVGRLRFTLAADGTPLTAALVRADKEVWRATRQPR